jgi:L-arabinonolactonase
LLWIDIQGATLHRYTPSKTSKEEEGKYTTWKLPKRPGSFALREEGPGLLIAFEDGFALYDPFTAATAATPQYLPASAYAEGTHPYHQHGEVRLNDGRCDRQGRFICGGYNGDEGDDEGREWEAACGVYIVEPKKEGDGGKGEAGAATAHIVAREFFPFKVRCANSTAFSPDGKVVYFADSPAREIWAFDYDQEAGKVKEETKRVFAEIPPPGVPDGSCVDAEGYVWNAEFFSGRVVRYTPEGKVDRVIQMPASRMTCPCLGGPELKTLYLTCASIGIEEGTEKGAGGIWAIEVETPGLVEGRFKG